PRSFPSAAATCWPICTTPTRPRCGRRWIRWSSCGARSARSPSWATCWSWGPTRCACIASWASTWPPAASTAWLESASWVARSCVAPPTPGCRSIACSSPPKRCRPPCVRSSGPAPATGCSSRARAACTWRPGPTPSRTSWSNRHALPPPAQAKDAVSWLSWLNVVRYTSTRMIAATMTALLLSFLLSPWFIRLLAAQQIGQVVRDDGPQSHLSKRGTPTMGGTLILFALVIPTLLWCDLRNGYVWLALLVTVGYGVVGFLDDYLKLARKNPKGLPGRVKMASQIAIGAVAVVILFWSDLMPPDQRYRLSLPFVAFQRHRLLLPLWLYVPFALIVIVGTSNAVNLTD